MKTIHLFACAAALATTVTAAQVGYAQQRRPFSRIAEFFGRKPSAAAQPKARVVATTPKVVVNGPIETSIQLAWLSDPVTFPYTLAAHNRSGRLEVHGFVPSDSIRRHALRIAERYSKGQVVDVLKVNRGVQVRRVKKSRKELMQAAASVLQKSFPQQHRGFYLNSTSDGKLYIRGSIPSNDGKLLVSESLRQVPGCACVVNELQVKPTATTQSPNRADPSQGVFGRAIERFRRMARGDDKKEQTTVQADNKSLRGDWRTSPPSTKPKYEFVSDKPSKRTPTTAVRQTKNVPGEREIENSSVESAPPQSKPVPANINTDHLQRRIQSVGGNRIRKVQVSRSNKGKLIISYEMVSPTHEQEVIERVFAMPELVPYQHNIELQFPTTAPPKK